jgi:predicted O-methyltransferase YrrM
MRGEARIRRAANRAVRDSFSFWERLGVHVTPVQYYQPVPDTRRLDPALWDRRSSMPGVDIAEADQLALVEELAATYGDEYGAFVTVPAGDPERFHFDNASFESVDAEVLYAMVRRLKPRRVLEVGSGFSSRIIGQALERNAAEDGGSPEHVVCDPFPDAGVRDGRRAFVRLIARPVEELAQGEFEALGDRDVLFIDSSHVLRIGNDVHYLFLEALPRLAPGVHVHVHDIFLPAEYPRHWVMRNHWFWNEQYLLQAFLAFNSAWQVLWAGSYMHLTHPEVLTRAFPSYGPDVHPGSLWMRRTDAGVAGPGTDG